MTGPVSSIYPTAETILEEAWDEERGYCYPHRGVYPHQWLWDSCFHTLAWAAIGDERGVRELEGIFAVQLENGFVPHMRYARAEMFRGPLAHASSYTQPPIYAHAARYLVERGLSVGPGVIESIGRGLDYLWHERRSDDGLIFIVHPWEAGSDDSPRWDSWVGSSEWNRPHWTAFDLRAVDRTRWGDAGDAVWSEEFVVAPSGFNALVAHAFAEYAVLSGDEIAAGRSIELASTIDAELWDESGGLWVDKPIVGGGADHDIPTLDGLLPALVTADRRKAQAVVEKLADNIRFAAPYGPPFVARHHRLYQPGTYWRGSVWPQLAYLMWLAASRWDAHGISDLVATTATAGTLISGFSEHWNPETGEAAGATPQTWAAVAAAYEHPALVPVGLEATE